MEILLTFKYFFSHFTSLFWCGTAVLAGKNCPSLAKILRIQKLTVRSRKKLSGDVFIKSWRLIKQNCLNFNEATSDNFIVLFNSGDVYTNLLGRDQAVTKFRCPHRQTTVTSYVSKLIFTNSLALYSLLLSFKTFQREVQLFYVDD